MLWMIDGIMNGSQTTNKTDCMKKLFVCSLKYIVTLSLIIHYKKFAFFTILMSLNHGFLLPELFLEIRWHNIINRWRKGWSYTTLIFYFFWNLEQWMENIKILWRPPNWKFIAWLAIYCIISLEMFF